MFYEIVIFMHKRFYRGDKRSICVLIAANAEKYRNSTKMTIIPWPEKKTSEKDCTFKHYLLYVHFLEGFNPVQRLIKQQ